MSPELKPDVKGGVNVKRQRRLATAFLVAMVVMAVTAVHYDATKRPDPICWKPRTACSEEWYCTYFLDGYDADGKKVEEKHWNNGNTRRSYFEDSGLVACEKVRP